MAWSPWGRYWKVESLEGGTRWEVFKSLKTCPEEGLGMLLHPTFLAIWDIRQRPQAIGPPDLGLPSPELGTKNAAPL